jgi:tetratricopeptide (TPR) repeat protein
VPPWHNFLRVVGGILTAGCFALSPAFAKEAHADAHPDAHAVHAAPVPPPNFDPTAPAQPAEPVAHGAPAPHAASTSEKPDWQAKEGRSLINLGHSLTEREDYAAAEIAYRRVMNDRGFPLADQRDALLGLARMYRQQTAFTKAVATYEKFLKLYPDDPRIPDALLELGRSQRAMGAYRSAINRFYNVINSTLKLPPESYEHYQLLAKTAQFEIAETHYEVGEFAEAAKFYDRLRLLDLAPEDRARAHFKSAGSLLNAGQLEPAVTKLNQFLDQWPADPHGPEARFLLALTLRKLGRTEEALGITLALLRNEYGNASADPKGWAYWQRRTGNQLANDFFQSGDTMSAVAIYESLAQLSEETTWRLPIVYQTGLCYERLRQNERAGKAYQEIIDTVALPPGKVPHTPEMIELARMAQWRIGQLDWSGRTEQQLNRFFSAAVPVSPPSPAPTTPANDANGSPATASGTL